MSKRTVRQFTFQGDLWKIVDEWAKAGRFEMIEEAEKSRKYRFTFLPVVGSKGWVCLTREGESVTVEAWVLTGWENLEERLLFGKRELEIDNVNTIIGIDGPSRVMLRNMVNKLLANLGQPPIA